MKDKLIRFVDNLNGQFVEVSSVSALNQCMDLAYAFIFCLDIPKATIQHGFAYQVYTEATDFTRQYFEVIKNEISTIPQPGDLAVFKGGTAGHIAVVIEATQLKMKVFGQNRPLGTNAHIADISYTNCLGFLRPILKGENGIPQYLSTLLQEASLKLEEEGKVREFWTKAVKYDGEIKGLKDQVISISEALSQRASEVSVLTEENQKLRADNDVLKADFNSERDKYNKEAWECQQQALKLQKALEEITDLEKEVEVLQSEKPLYGYSWITRFNSLWRR